MQGSRGHVQLRRLRGGGVEDLVDREVRQGVQRFLMERARVPSVFEPAERHILLPLERREIAAIRSLGFSPRATKDDRKAREKEGSPEPPQKLAYSSTL